MNSCFELLIGHCMEYDHTLVLDCSEESRRNSVFNENFTKSKESLDFPNNNKMRILFSPNFNFLVKKNEFKEDFENSNKMEVKLKKEDYMLSTSLKNSEFTFNNRQKNDTQISFQSFSNQDDLIFNQNSFFKKIYMEDEIGKLLHGRILIINHSGLEHSIKKNHSESITYFGNSFNEGEIKDFELNFGINGDNKQLHFCIFYKKSNQNYYFKNLSDKENRHLIYLKIENPLKIKKQNFFCVGDSIFSIETFKNMDNVVLKFYSKSIVLSKFDYFPSDSPITIGRKNCKININSNVYSKYQCCLYYESGKWLIIDGINKKKSTNGTWLLIDHKFKIEGSNKLKIGPNVVKIEVK